MNCFRCGSKEHFIRDCPQKETEKGQSKGRDQYKDSKGYKPSFSKSDVKKAMIGAWGDSDSEDGEELADETANLCLMARSDDEANMKELEAEVWFDYDQLKVFSKEKLIDIVLDIQNDWIDLTVAKAQSDKALNVIKEHAKWEQNMYADFQTRFFDLFDKNAYLKEIVERLKHDNILLNVELSLSKLLNASSDSEVPLKNYYPDFQKFMSDFETLKLEKKNLEEELERARKGKEVVNQGVPPWITKAKSKKNEGLGSKKEKKKKRVELPSSKVCFYCGLTGHFVNTCAKKIKDSQKNVRQVWMKKSDIVSETKEPKDAWVPPSNV